jgi:hypothetical protein
VKRLIGAALASVALAVTACGPDISGNLMAEPSSSPNASVDPSPSMEPTPTPSGRKAKTALCSDVVVPDGGLGEADFNLDKEQRLLTINFSDVRRDTYRNIAYTVRYDADPSCADVPQMAQVIARVIPGR